MRSVTIIAGLFGLIVSIGSTAAATPTTQPATAGGDVYLTPFAPVGVDSHLDWAGRAVQENLLTDLARCKLHPVAATQPTSSTDAQMAAKSAGAKYLITGTYQMVDQLLRFNGQIINVKNGSVVGGITATGPERDLFAMEDAMSAQAVQQLSRLPGVTVVTGNFIRTAPLPPALQPAALQQVIQPPSIIAGSSYQGSALQAELDSNLTPSTDFDQQVQDSTDRLTYSPAVSVFPYLSYGYGFGNCYGGYGISYGIGRYGYGYGHGGFGIGGSFHHGGFTGSIGGGFTGGHGHR